MNEKRSAYISARNRLRAGEDKLKLFEEYKESVGEKGLANLLAVYPDRDLDLKFNYLNKLLLGALFVLTVLKLLSILEVSLGEMSIKAVLAISAFALAINGVAIYVIYIKHARAYRIVALFCLQGFIKLFEPSLISEYSSIFDWVWLGVSMACLVIIIWLGFSLPKKMFPYHGWFKPKEQANGIPMFTAAQMP